MQLTVGPCHRDRKQKRNEKREEGERQHSRRGRGVRGREVAGWANGSPSRWHLCGGSKAADAADIRGGLHERNRALALGRGRKGDYAKATVTAQRTEGRKKGKSQSRQGPQDHQRPGKNACVPECLEPEPSPVPSRVRKEGRCALKKGWKG